MGICHAYAPDGRCISLLKILLTNSCIFDCHYCINRKSSNVRRARFTVDEVVQLTLAFYRRNYIEGLFLSSGIIGIVELHDGADGRGRAALRDDHDFRGYIHLKTIPDADPELVHQAGLYADRVSINVELPTDERAEPARAGEGRRRASRARWRELKAEHRRQHGREEASTEVGPEVRARRPIDADDRRRGRRDRRRHRRASAAGLYGKFGLAARLLFAPSRRSPMRARCCR